MSSSGGEWMIERSDGFIIGFSKVTGPIIFGRDKNLQPSHRVDHKYISSRHFSVECREQSLFIRQLGKNPTFYSREFKVLPGGVDDMKEAEFRVGESTHITDAVDTNHGGDGVILVNPITRRQLMCGIGTANLTGIGGVDESTLHFPEELHLPRFMVRYVLNDKVGIDPHINNNNIPTVPQGIYSCGNMESNNGGSNDNDDDDDFRSAPWRGILDAVLIEQQAKKATVPNSEHIAGETSGPVSVERPESNTQVEKTRQKSPPGKGNICGVMNSIGIALSDIGTWEWKCHTSADDDDAKAWRRYPRGVEEFLEKAYRTGETIVKVPNKLIHVGTTRDPRKNGKNYGYSVCFCEDSLDGGMIQFQTNDKTKYRRIRRRGGCDVDRSGVSNVRVISDRSDDDFDESSSSSSSSSFSSSRDSDDSSSSESSFESSSSDSESPVNRKRRR